MARGRQPAARAEWSREWSRKWALPHGWQAADAQDGRGALRVAEAPGVYRPRRPEKTAFYRLIAGQFDRYVQVHEERFAPRAGPLRPVVPEAVGEYLDCGLLANGFARLRCASCGAEHLLAFSCRTRNFCPSCQAKRAAAFAEHLREEVVLPVLQRHVTFTIPRALRGLFERDRSLLGLLARCAYEALRRLYQARVGRKDAVPGVVASIQTFGSYLNFHPHVHALATEGVVAPDGTFVPVPAPDLGAVCELYRRLVLAELRRRERLSAEFHTRLLGERIETPIRSRRDPVWRKRLLVSARFRRRGAWMGTSNRA